MKIETIETTEAPAAIGPYSQAKKVGNFVFTSGQIPVDPSSGKVIEGGVDIQAQQVFENVKAVLEASGTKMENVIKATVFLKDMGDFAAMNEVYSDYFPEKPARSCVQVAKLPLDVKVEVEVIALIE